MSIIGQGLSEIGMLIIVAMLVATLVGASPDVFLRPLFGLLAWLVRTIIELLIAGLAALGVLLFRSIRNRRRRRN